MAKKMTSCQYDNSRIGFTDENGKYNSYACCDMCGKWHKGQYGLIINFNIPDKQDDGRTTTRCGFRRIKLCRKCGCKLAPDLISLDDKLCNRAPQEDESELGKKIAEAERQFFESLEIPEGDEEERSSPKQSPGRTFRTSTRSTYT